MGTGPLSETIFAGARARPSELCTMQLNDRILLGQFHNGRLGLLMHYEVKDGDGKDMRLPFAFYSCTRPCGLLKWLSGKAGMATASTLQHTTLQHTGSLPQVLCGLPVWSDASWMRIMNDAAIDL